MKRLFTYLALLLTVQLLIGNSFATGAPSASPNHDFTEVPASGSTQREYVTVVLSDPPAASYLGGIPGLERTKPEPGQKLNANSPAEQAYVGYLKRTHQDYTTYLANKAPQAEIVREFFLASNGFAVRLNGANAGTLFQGPGVRTVAFSTLVKPTMTVSTGLVNAPAVWPLAGGRANAGAGIKIGIIDTGIVDTHPAFGCKSPIQHKVFASGVAGFGPTIVFDHGTHVTGTAAGCVLSPPFPPQPVTGTWSGMAPGAQPFDYNVFPGFGAGFVAFGGSAFSHDIIGALEESIRDGMDVDNMSLGGGVSGPHDLLADAVDATVDAGLVVAVAAGNSGPGDSTVTSPGNAPNALTAGASTNPHFVGIPVTVGGSTFGAALGDFNNFIPAVTADYATTSPANGCSSISTPLAGKIALIVRGACTFTTKIRNAQAAGAIGVLVRNNVAGDPSAMGHDGTSPFPTIPAAMLSKADGLALGSSGTATVNGTSPTEFITTNADIIAAFSGRGPTPFTFLVKPDVTAPGVNVYSSVFNGQFAFFQGTSMATPHVAGAAALLLDLHPGWSPADVKSALANTAKRPVFDHVTGTNPVGVLTRGGGRIQMDAANAIPLTFDTASVSFGLFKGNVPVSGTRDVLVRNVAGSSQLCSVAVTGSTAAATVSASTGSISLSPGGTTTLTLTLNGGRAAQTPSGDYTGDAVVNCGGTTLKVPWWTRVDRLANPGDVNQDLRVDILDAALVAYAYGTRDIDPSWNPNADVDHNGVIDILDAAIIGYNYGTGT